MNYQPLSQSKINDIEAITLEILRETYGKIDQLRLPITVADIAHKYGLKLYSGEYADLSVSGAYDKKEKAILIASDEPAERIEFTIAHELGHFFLHEKKQTDIFYRKQMFHLNDENKEEEKEANWFAASLLMPKKSVFDYYPVAPDLETLSTLFGVSITAVYYRLKNLGIMK